MLRKMLSVALILGIMFVLFPAASAEAGGGGGGGGGVTTTVTVQHNPDGSRQRDVVRTNGNWIAETYRYWDPWGNLVYFYHSFSVYLG